MTIPASNSHVDVQEAARIVGLSESTIWRYLRRGTLPSLRKGGRRLIPRSALDQFAVGRDQEEIAPLRRDHPIFRLVGAGRSGGSLPGARDKYGVLSG